MFIRKAVNDLSAQEYGGDFRRLYPWKDVATPPWGSAWMTIPAGAQSTPHDHDEDETFIILSGKGVMHVDAECADVERGDIVFLPRFSKHRLENASSAEALELLCIWWGGKD